MDEQPLNLQRTLRILRRHIVLLILVAMTGFAAGAAYAITHPPLYASETLVLLSSAARDTRTQVVIAESDPVLIGALHAQPGMSIENLRTHVQVKILAYNLISIGARSANANDAERTANGVARSYVDYLASGSLPDRSVSAHMLQPANDASAETSRPVWVAKAATVGGFLATIIAAIAVVAVGRSDRRLRQRDEIALAAGAPVLASVPIGRTADVAGWKRLLYKHRADEGTGDIRLRTALASFDLLGVNARGSSIGVLSLATDRPAAHVAPRLARVAASLGIPTSFVISADRHDADAAAPHDVNRASATGSERTAEVDVITTDDSSDRWNMSLVVVPHVIDDKSTDGICAAHTTVTVLGVSAGATTAEQLVRVTASLRVDGRRLDGVIVVNADRGDQTSGRLPRWPMPTGSSGSPKPTMRSRARRSG